MEAMDSVAFPPVIVYTSRALTPEQEQRLRRYSSSIVKGARSPERLLDEVTLFLHSVESAPAGEPAAHAAPRRAGATASSTAAACCWRSTDSRKIFVLSSVFEPLGVTMEIARNGRDALECLRRGASISS
ncbi:MAG: histidine kinase [Ramlibacter sp.]|nr:histidine kinase [Ramlibacter sp.]